MEVSWHLTPRLHLQKCAFLPNASPNGGQTVSRLKLPHQKNFSRVGSFHPEAIQVVGFQPEFHRPREPSTAQSRLTGMKGACPGFASQGDRLSGAGQRGVRLGPQEEDLWVIRHLPNF